MSNEQTLIHAWMNAIYSVELNQQKEELRNILVSNNSLSGEVQWVFGFDGKICGFPENYSRLPSKVNRLHQSLYSRMRHFTKVCEAMMDYNYHCIKDALTRLTTLTMSPLDHEEVLPKSISNVNPLVYEQPPSRWSPEQKKAFWERYGKYLVMIREKELLNIIGG
jgi:hypothetical protein